MFILITVCNGWIFKCLFFSCYCSVPPSIEDGATVVAATVNSRTLLSCDTIGLPRPQVRWEKNGRAVRQTGARYVMSRTGSLQLNDVRVADSGTYRCIAENSAGTASRDVQLLVHGKVVTQHIRAYINYSVCDGVSKSVRQFQEAQFKHYILQAAMMSIYFTQHPVKTIACITFYLLPSLPNMHYEQLVMVCH